MQTLSGCSSSCCTSHASAASRPLAHIAHSTAPAAAPVPGASRSSRRQQRPMFAGVAFAAAATAPGSSSSAASPRLRRVRRTSSSAPADPPSSSSSEQQQQQQQRRRRAPRDGSSSTNSSNGGAPDEGVDPLDAEFLEPEQAARLRKLMKKQGREAVVDARGFVREALLQAAQEAAAAPAAKADTRRPQDVAAAAAEGLSSTAAAPADAAAGSAADAAAPARSRLFGASQLQPAVPGSGGTAPALPIVRPSPSTSSPTRPGSGSSSSGGSSAGGFHSASSWQQLGASAGVVEALAALGITRPSHVQAEAYKALGSGSSSSSKGRRALRHVALADQAGSGKTLAYLLPLLQALKQREAAAGGSPVAQPRSPSIVIMAPTTELAQQVGRVVRALSHAGLRVRSTVMTGGQSDADRRGKSFRTQTELLAGGVDVVVATPGRLLAHVERGSLSLESTDALVLDEVDVLAGGEVSYSEHIAPLRAAAPASMRCVLVSATLPQHTFDELQELFPGLGAAFGPGLHRTAAGVVEELVDCSGGEEVSLESGTQRKLDAMFKALERVRSPRSIVFCNKIETCRVVENALKRQKGGELQVLAYHEAIRDDARAAALTTWLAPPRAGEPPSVLVCTDRTSRGIDSMWCDHVVLFEFPRDPSEYVRRVGRTARGAGGRGVVSVLVLGKQVALAQGILARNRGGAPVHRVPRLWSDA